MLRPFADRAGVDNNLVSIFPGLSRPVSSGPVVPLNPLRIRFIRLTTKSFDVINFVIHVLFLIKKYIRHGVSLKELGLTINLNRLS